MFGQFGNNPAMGVQQGLPANPTQITQPWYNVGPANPPYVPRVTMDPQLQSLVPLISGVAAGEIQQQAASKMNQPLRVFMHNLYSINGFQNEHFENLLAACLDFVWVHVGKGAYQNAEQAIADGVPKVVEMLAGMQPAMYPQLVAFLDPGTQQAVLQLQQVFGSISQEIKAIKQRHGFGQAMNVGAGMAGGYGMQGQMVPVAPGPRFGVTGGINMPGSSVSPLGGSQSIFSGSRTQQFVGDGSRAPITPSRYDEKIMRQPLPKKEEPVQQAPQPIAQVVAQPPVAAPQAERVEEQLIPAAKVKWKPTREYPYVPAYDPSQVELFFRVNANGQFEPVLKETNTVDYERHAVSATFGPRPVGWQPGATAQILERIKQSVEQLNEPPAPDAEAVGTEETPRATLPFTSAVRAKWLMETCELPLWIAGAIERLSTRVGAEQEIPDIYRLYAKVAYPVVGLRDETDAVRELGTCKTFLELREKLRSFAGKVSAALWAAANERMTSAVNRMLKQNLSLISVNIDSFVDDIEDLVGVLQKRYGDFVSEAFTKHQVDHIRRVFGVPREEEAEGLTATMIDPEEYTSIDAPKITYLASNYSFTFLNCRAHELNIELGPAGVASVHQTMVPVMHELLRGLFEASDAAIVKASEEALADGIDVPAPIDRHLIRTSDGRVLEAQRGYLGDDFYVLSLVE